MEQQRLMSMVEEHLTRFLDRVRGLDARLEDLNFRAHRIHSAARLNQKSRDVTFGDDLGTLRKSVRTFCSDASILPGLMDSLDRNAAYAPNLLNPARALMSKASNTAQALESFLDSVRILHQHVNDSDQKIQAWYMVSELEEIARKVRGMPATLSNKVIQKIINPPAGAPADPPPAPPKPSA